MHKFNHCLIASNGSCAKICTALSVFEAKEQRMEHVNQGRCCRGETKLYFSTNSGIKGQSEETGSV